MKSSKRITALVVTLIFVFTSVMSLNVFAADDSAFTDLDSNNAYYKAITSLVADGVINGYAEADGTFTFKPDNTITRAEFSKLLATASAPAGYAFTATTTQFPDVADANAEAGWAIPYIAYAVGTGAINGYEDGTFRPQNPVTYAEAVKMIVCTLGYGKVVDTTLNPWYQGYLDVANQIGLTNRAQTVATNNAPRGLVAQLIYNMKYECKVYSAVVDSSGNEINITGGSSKLDESEEGVLYGVFEYCLTGDELTKQEVLIDDEIYQLGSRYTVEELKDYVGYSIKFEITGDRKKALTRVSKVSGENDTTTIEDWQIASINADEIEYYADEDAYDEDEPSTLKFGKNFYVIYNGYVVNPDDIDDEFIEEYLDVTSGEIEFISNDGNTKTVEVAVVESYDLYHVKSVSTVNGVTTFYDTNATELGLTGGIAIDEDDAVDSEGEANVTKITSKGGSATKSTLAGISKNSTVAVAVPFDSKEGTKVIISAVSFSGTVKELDSSYEYVKIGSDKYEFSPYFDAIMDAGVDVTLETGDTAKFYLDPMGRISYLEKTESSNPYGLIIAYASGSGVDSIPMLQILNTSNKVLEYPLKDKVKINGNSRDADEVIDILKESSPIYTDEMEDEGSKNIVQPVKYVTSTQNGKTVFSELEIIDMDNPSEGNITPYPIKNTENSEKTEFANGGKLKYSKSGYAFKDGNATQFTMSSSTVLFIVPSDLNNKTSYRKATATGYFTDTASYCVEPYDVESGTTAKLVVYYSANKNTSVTVQGGTPVAFVEKVSDSTKDGVEGKKLVYYNPGSYESKEAFAPFDSDVIDDLEKLNPGDVIKFVQDNGEIAQIKTVYVEGALTTECGNKFDGFENYITQAYDGTDDYFQAILGTVSTLEDGNKITVVPMFVDDEEFDPAVMYAFNWTDSTSFFDFDEKEKEFIQTSDGALRSYEDAVDDASQVIVILSGKNKVVAIYDLSE